MAIFDIEKDQLLQLSDTQLEELIARLAEAELAANGYSPAYVNWSGSLTAPDGGIDIHVQVPADNLSLGFIERPETVLQSKKHKMPKGKIATEMLTSGKLSPVISALAAKGGSYIIVSLADDCSPKEKSDRLQAMRKLAASDLNGEKLHLDFYDRSKLVQWLRHHPAVMLWVKEKLGQSSSGWKPYGAWSHPPKDDSDKLILSAGVKIMLPSNSGEPLGIEDALAPMRDLIRTTDKAVRITGLSGVGKTRIVQALFDESIGQDALDRTIAIYADTGDEPNPSASAMLDRLIAEQRKAVMILDNCPSELHGVLADKLSATATDISLITVEYDIQDGKPQTTEVIHIEADGLEMAEQLVLRRFPHVGSNNARRIAQYADGNARVSLAIAERVEAGESLAQLSDKQLFNRLFEQRNHANNSLREQAEILSLVYSFSVSPSEGESSELAVLSSLSEYSFNQLYRSVSQLAARNIVQKRSQWRAILPQAIANELAASALNCFPIDQLIATFESSGRQRLLMSFAHRLGLLHEHPVAVEIVEGWLEPDGLLGQILSLNDELIRVLDYVAPVAPDKLLDTIEVTCFSSDLSWLESRHNPRRTTVVRWLQLLAYEPKAFERCVMLLMQVSGFETQSNSYDSAGEIILRFFQAYLSGTHATLEQRIAFMNKCIMSEQASHRALGFKMLSRALTMQRWTGFGVNEFGARPRDYGYHPNRKGLVDWFHAFLDIATSLGMSGELIYEVPAREVIAKAFYGLWDVTELQSKLITIARQFNEHSPWGEGLKAIRSMISLRYTQQKDAEKPKTVPVELAKLVVELEPKDLVSQIKTYVLGGRNDPWALDAYFDRASADRYQDAYQRLKAKALELGWNFASSCTQLRELRPSLFSSGYMPYRAMFGKGLARGTNNLNAMWNSLLNELHTIDPHSWNYAVFGGFIEETANIDVELAQQFLGQSSQHPQLRHVIVNLHPWGKFTETDLARCIAVLDQADVSPQMYGDILWQSEYANLPQTPIIDLAYRLLTMPEGDDVVLNALGMKLDGNNQSIDMLGCELRRVGLCAAAKRIKPQQINRGMNSDHFMERVIHAALVFDGNESEKLAWLDAIFSVADSNFGFVFEFEHAVETTAALMPEAFLNRVFDGVSEELHRARMTLLIGEDDRSFSPIMSIPDTVLLNWCRARNDSDIWLTIASAIQFWSKDDEAQCFVMSKLALRFLDAAPEPEKVIEAFAKRISRSGIRADVMQHRTDAIKCLETHENQVIATAAKSAVDVLLRQVAEEKAYEQQRESQRELRFE
ncbi:hypothetical protein L9G15_06285 [Shewanella sp. A3A]|nr:hypothetical protein [Shewanella ferrihydritica]